jgi:hypothetical protein
MNTISFKKILNYPEYDLPTINIAVVGDKNIGKTSLIRFWLSFGSDTIITNNTYSKIFWMENNPVQINICKISKNINNSQFENKIYHAIVYVYDITNCTSNNSVNYWFDAMEKYKKFWTHQYIISLSKNEIIPEKIITDKNIEHYASSLSIPSILSDILNNITISAYKSAKDNHNEYYLTITNSDNEFNIFVCDKINTPLIFGYIEDEFYVIGNEENNNIPFYKKCCIIV